MKVSLNWLNDHLDLSGKSTQELDDLLTFAGIEVEGIEQRGGNIDKVVVAKILESQKHPDADKLTVCKVDDGSGEPLQIVCGAKNYTVGDKVPLAQVGAELSGGFKIKKGKLRGVESNGMLCSARELEISDDHEGLMILPEDAPVGAPIGSLFDPDTVFDLEITPNRPDCLSHRGVARELGVLTKTAINVQELDDVPEQKANDDEVRISALEACPLYTARMIRDVKVTESPEWLKTKLEAVGLRPINNVVDITNYVLLEVGQPLHAFDNAKLDGGIHVRAANEGETFLALDGIDYALEPEDLVIADQSKAVAIAGVMGGELTGVTESTTDVLLESAYFNPPNIRRTSRRLNLSSDSSYRFERGVDPQGVATASALATKLILEMAGGEADELIVCGTAPTLTGTVTLDHAKCRQLLGVDISEDQIEQILGGLGITKASGDDDRSQWNVPSWRADIQRHADLVEEIARVYGLDRIPSSQSSWFSDINPIDVEYDFISGVAEKLADAGFFEARTIKLISEGQLADHLCPLIPSEPVALKNPLSDDHTHMRPGMIPGLLAVAERNVRMGATALRFFETGTVFNQTKDGKTLERSHLGILISGDSHPVSWHDNRPAPADFSELRGVLETLADGTALHPIDPNDRLVLAAEIRIGKQKVGLAGQLWPARARQLDIESPVLVAEIDLAKLRSALTSGKTQFRELPKFPAVTRDIAMEVPRDLPNKDIEDFFAGTNEPLLVGYSLFDVFVDDGGVKLDRDKKSIAYSLTYRDDSRTLQSAEVDAAHSKVLEALQAALPAKLR